MYQFLSETAKIGYLVLFKAIHVHQREIVPADKPVLLASNHPTAFMECVMWTSYTPPPIYSMTRGDIFEKPIFRKLLATANMFPVFRARDGYNDRHKNDAVFDFIRERLMNRNVVIIYPEGEHNLSKRIRPLQKGLPRIAFNAATQDGLTDLLIIPIAANFDYGDRTGDTVMLNYGTPLPIQQYLDQYAVQPGAAINKLLADITQQLKALSIHVDDPNDEALAEQLLEMHATDNPDPIFLKITANRNRFDVRKALIDRMNALQPDRKSELKDTVNQYFDALKKHGLTDFGLMHPRKGNWLVLIFLVLTFPVFVLGYISSWGPIALSNYMVKKRVRKREFITSVLFGVGFLFSLIYFPILMLLCVIFGNIWVQILGLISIPLAVFKENYLIAARAYAAANKAKNCVDRTQLLQWRRELGI